MVQTERAIRARERSLLLFVPRRIRVARVRPREGDANAPGERRVDTELLDLMPFLESIVRLDVKDVREVLESYQKEQEKTGLSVPEIFRARQTRFQQSRRAKSSSVGGFSREGKKWGR